VHHNRANQPPNKDGFDLKVAETLINTNCLTLSVFP